jgi:hypothetical protein
LFVWSPAVQEAFDAVKIALSSAPVLALPNFDKQFILETDACNVGIGAVLMQDGHPIAYLSQSLNKTDQGRSTYEQECLAILLAVDKWRSYSQHKEFIIRTDQRSLQHLGDQWLTTGIQYKAFVKLMGLQYQIQYKAGISNAVADALSRCESQPVSAISTCTPSWQERLDAGYQYHDKDHKLLSALSLPGSHPMGFSLVDGIIRYKSRIWVGHNTLAQGHILQALHSSGIGEHFGIQGTYQRINALFAWPIMKHIVTSYVQACTVCQQAKVEHVKLPGMLQPLPIPSQAWSVVSLDFIEGLPRSNNHNAILVVIDKFSKYAHFVPLTHPFTALQIAQVYFNQVYKLHGLPSAIISDRDRIFTSNLWQELFKLSDTQLLMSTSYHPQTDGQTERLNQCLETFLRCAMHASPGKWFQWLPLAEYWYNTTYHSALGHSPFEVLYGHPPRHFGTTDFNACSLPYLEDWLKN